MKKEDLLTLWNVKDWDKNNAGIYFTGKYGNKEVNFNFTGFTEKDMFIIPDDFMQRLFREFVKNNKEKFKEGTDYIFVGKAVLKEKLATLKYEDIEKDMLKVIKK